jgi:virginiamycin B lyase
MNGFMSVPREGARGVGGTARRRRSHRPLAEVLERRALLAATITEYPSFPALHTDFGNNPSSIVLRDGAMWFTARGSNQIGRLDPASLAPTFSPPTSDSPLGLALAPDQSLWYTAQGANRIGKFVPSTGQIVEYPLPTPNSQPTGITVGPDGNLWFTEQTANKIGRITPDGVITEFALPTTSSNPYAITVGPDNNLWFTEFNTSRIGRITTSGVISEFPTPTAGSGPLGIVAGSDGKLWFTEFAADKIGRIDPASGAIVEFALQRPAGLPPGVVASGPQGITVGPDGAIYFTEAYSSRVGRITTAGAIQEYATPTPSSRPIGIAAGPDGALWFTQFDTNGLGRLVYTPDNATDRAGDFDGDGRADLAVFRSGSALWLAAYSSGTGALVQPFGGANFYDLPITADYDGDGRADLAVFRPAEARWLVAYSGGGGMNRIFGAPNLYDIPVPADYDGDGRADLAVFRRPEARWLSALSGGGVMNTLFGYANLFDIPVTGDYDGDGKSDITVFRPTEARWITTPSSGAPWIDRIFGAANLIDVPLRAPIASLYAVGRFPSPGGQSFTRSVKTTSFVEASPPIETTRAATTATARAKVKPPTVRT